MNSPVDKARQALTNSLAEAEALESRAAAVGLIPYLKRVVIDARPEPKPFGEIADSWQWDGLAELTPRVEFLTGHRTTASGPRCFWRTLPRGHDKTSSIARVANWILAFARRRVKITVAAADSDQALLLLEAAAAEAQYNPYLKDRITYQNKRAIGPGGILRCLEADAKSTYGLISDIYIVDELTHWKKRDLWDALWSGRHKRPGSMFLVITNAGEKDSWQEDILKEARRSPAEWSVFEAPPNRTLASWMTAKDVADTVKMLPPGLASRVVWNRWVSPTEGRGYLLESDVLPCIVPGLLTLSKGRGQRQWLSCDYGPTKDRTVLASLHFDQEAKRFVIDELLVLQGSPENRVQLSSVDEWLDSRIRAFGNVMVVLDPYQMESTAQRLENRGIEVKRFEARGGKSNYELCEKLRTTVVNHQIAWRPEAGVLPTPSGMESLADELTKLILKVTPYGYRIDHEAGKHDDRACAIGMALVEALEDPQILEWIGPSPLVNRDSRPLTPRVLADKELEYEGDFAVAGRGGPLFMGRKWGDFGGLYGR